MRFFVMPSSEYHARNSENEIIPAVWCGGVRGRVGGEVRAQDVGEQQQEEEEQEEEEQEEQEEQDHEQGQEKEQQQDQQEQQRCSSRSTSRGRSRSRSRNAPSPSVSRKTSDMAVSLVFHFIALHMSTNSCWSSSPCTTPAASTHHHLHNHQAPPIQGASSPSRQGTAGQRKTAQVGEGGQRTERSVSNFLKK